MSDVLLTRIKAFGQRLTASHSPNTAAATAALVESVIARIYFAGLPLMADGTPIEIEVEGDEEGDERDQPLVMVQKSIFGVTYQHDARNYLAWLTQGELEQTKISASQLQRIGIKNLANRVKEQIGQLRVKPHGRAYQLVLDEQWDASLLLLDFVWDNSLQHLSRSPVVAIPTRAHCAFCDADDLQAIDDLRVYAAQVCENSDKPLDAGLFARNQHGLWTRFETT